MRLGIYGSVVRNLRFAFSFGTDLYDLVRLVVLQLFDYRVHDIHEDDLITGFMEEFGDESSSNISPPEVDCAFHVDRVNCNFVVCGCVDSGIEKVVKWWIE